MRRRATLSLLLLFTPESHAFTLGARRVQRRGLPGHLGVASKQRRLASTTLAADDATAVFSAPAVEEKEVTTTIAAPAVEVSETEERRKLDATIIRLALPAMCGALIDPLLSLVDSGFVGRLGSEALGALGPACEIFTFCFAMCWALRDATCSLTATSLAKGDDAGAARLLRTSLALGVALSVGVGLLLRSQTGALLGIMGLPASSPMFTPAAEYLRVRALAFPAVVLLCVCEGGFRGCGDTRSPVLAGLVAGAVNLVLDPILMFRFGLGMRGAAAATAIAQVAACAFALSKLAPRLRAPSSSSKEQSSSSSSSSSSGAPLQLRAAAHDAARDLRQLLGAGGAMFLRTGSILTYWTIGTALATRLGTTAVAAHHVALQIWLFFVLPVEGPAVANQVLLPRALAKASSASSASSSTSSSSSSSSTAAAASSSSSSSSASSSSSSADIATGGEDPLASARRLMQRVLRLSLGSGVSVAALLVVCSPAYSSLFALRPPVAAELMRVLPIAAGLLPLVASNMALESFLTGAKCFRYLAVGTIFSTTVASGVLLALSTTPAFCVQHIWLTICGFFALRSSVAGARVWAILRRSRREALATATAAPSVPAGAF